MVTILPPDFSITFLGALIVPLIIGFLIGLILKRAISIGIALAALVLVLIILGIVAPSQLVQPLISIFRSGAGLASKASEIAGFLPYSSIGFLVGLVLGFLKG